MASGADRELVRRARDVAQRAAYEAGALLRERVKTERVINHKGTVDLVTDADEESERLIAGVLKAAFPGFRLAGEEGATGAAESDYGWLIDPIDGTTNFAHGYPHFAVSICLDFRGTPVMGVVYDPMRDEMFVGAEGLGATLNGEPIHVSTVDTLILALGATGFNYDIDARQDATALWNVFNGRMQGLRRDGAAALDMVWVAVGRLDAFWESPVNGWDVGAGVVIAREAGGRVASLTGGEYVLSEREVICTNAVLHDQVVSLIRETLGQLQAS
jgi:myo-inositol-1(or 4)-monophosphatase